MSEEETFSASWEAPSSPSLLQHLTKEGFRVITLIKKESLKPDADSAAYDGRYCVKVVEVIHDEEKW